MHKPSATTDTAASADQFAPPAVADGYTRVVAPTISGIQPGGDVLKCQFVLAPFDREGREVALTHSLSAERERLLDLLDRSDELWQAGA